MDGTPLEQLQFLLQPFDNKELQELILDICKSEPEGNNPFTQKILERCKTHRKWCKLFVHQLSYKTTKEDLVKFYSQFGNVTEAVILMHKNGNSKGYGFVTFANADDAIAASKEEERKIDGRVTHCTLAWRGNPKKQANPSWSPNTKESVDDRRLFVHQLAWKTTDETLRKKFAQYGEIKEAVVIKDKKTGKSKGYGFVTFKHKESAAKALLQMNKIIDGRTTRCNYACEKDLLNHGISDEKENTPIDEMSPNDETMAMIMTAHKANKITSSHGPTQSNVNERHNMYQVDATNVPVGNVPNNLPGIKVENEATSCLLPTPTMNNVLMNGGKLNAAAVSYAPSIGISEQSLSEIFPAAFMPINIDSATTTPIVPNTSFAPQFTGVFPGFGTTNLLQSATPLGTTMIPMSQQHIQPHTPVHVFPPSIASSVPSFIAPLTQGPLLSGTTSYQTKLVQPTISNEVHAEPKLYTFNNNTSTSTTTAPVKQYIVVELPGTNLKDDFLSHEKDEPISPRTQEEGEV